MFRMFWIRLLLMLLVGSSGMMQSISTGNKLALAGVFSWFGVNAFYLVGIPALALFIFLPWGKQEVESGQMEEEVTGWMRFIFSPFSFLGRCIWNAFKDPKRIEIDSTSLAEQINGGKIADSTKRKKS